MESCRTLRVGGNELWLLSFYAAPHTGKVEEACVGLDGYSDLLIDVVDNRSN
jgi:hypothetical protein